MHATKLAAAATDAASSSSSKTSLTPTSQTLISYRALSSVRCCNDTTALRACHDTKLTLCLLIFSFRAHISAPRKGYTLLVKSLCCAVIAVSRCRVSMTLKYSHMNIVLLIARCMTWHCFELASLSVILRAAEK